MCNKICTKRPLSVHKVLDYYRILLFTSCGGVAVTSRPPKNPPGEAIEGGEAGDDGPPLEVLGGLMRFSFCRLLK